MVSLKRELSYFDLTNIVVGAIIGSDIYIASAITAGLIGPFSIVVWVLAGIMAGILAIIFAYSSYYVPKVGGPFAYVSTAYNDFYGFLAGWSMWVAEVISLPVFAITFTNYLQYFLPLGFFEVLLVRAIFLFGLTAVNIFGVKAAGRVNDALTLIKLSPLLLLVIVGLGSFAVNPGFLSNYSPLAPFGFNNLGTAIVLIFWAYVGFELGTLPADEVQNPGKTIPKAILTGIAIVAAFYVSTNFIIFGAVSSSKLAGTTIPLVLVATAILGSFGGAIMSIGALFSVSGSDESGILGTARLSYALSIDGLFPKAFSRVHKKYATPYMALIIQGVIAFGLSAFSGLSNLISFSVLNLSFSFLLVSIAFIRLRRQKEKGLFGQNVLPWLGIAICLFLLYSTSLFDKILGAAVILGGIPLYVYFSPKVDASDFKASFLSGEAILARNFEKTDRFLARLLKFIGGRFKGRRT
ncbi:MAG: APC family permease [Thaumarchaeota archaeon]|nr:APC family permease [Nitrososphaerota archaeon]